jgi:hypothetical protein
MVSCSGGQWSASGYHAITVGKATSSVRTIAVVAGRIWAGYRNTIVVFNAKDFAIEVISPLNDDE